MSITPQGYEYGIAPRGSHPFWDATGEVTGVTASVEVGENTGTPSASVDATYNEGVVNLDFQFDGLKGEPGQDGTTPIVSATATVDNTSGTPAVSVSKTGSDAAPSFNFAFTGLKGEIGAQGPAGPAGADGRDGSDGETPNVTATATVDNTSGTPSVTVTKTAPDQYSANFNFAFTGLKGTQGPAGPAGLSAGYKELDNVSKAGLHDLLTGETKIEDVYIFLRGADSSIYNKFDCSGFIRKFDGSAMSVFDGSNCTVSKYSMPDVMVHIPIAPAGGSNTGYGSHAYISPMPSQNGRAVFVLAAPLTESGTTVNTTTRVKSDVAVPKFSFGTGTIDVGVEFYLQDSLYGSDVPPVASDTIQVCFTNSLARVRMQYSQFYRVFYKEVSTT